MKRIKFTKLFAAVFVLVLSLPAIGFAAVTGQLSGSTRASVPSVTANGTIYVANEGTGTVSVIDGASNTVTATICLGSDPAMTGTPQPAGPCNAETAHHNPFYNGHLGTHGLWLTPDGKVLLVANRISGTVVAVDTDTNKVLGYTPVGREPHLATVRPGGREAWVAVRGESQIEVLDLDAGKLWDSSRRRTDRMPHLATIDTVGGPSMVSFTSDGKFAFVAAGKEQVVHKINANSKNVVASAAVAAKFTPFGLVSPDDQELWMVHKGAGSISVLRTSDLSPIVQNLSVGPRANHVAFVGKYAYITVGGPPPSAANGTDPAGKIVIIDRTTHQIVRTLAGAWWTGDPHGIWPSPDGTILYVGHERGNRLSTINTGDPNNAADDAYIGHITDPAMTSLVDVVVR